MRRVEVRDVGKRYRLGAGAQNAREALSAAGQRLVNRRRQPSTDLWSLRNVTFDVDDGEALGIVGPNGAGKSTILKILAGITSPTTGMARTRGRVAALLEVGTGFHPELTGRENVYLNGAILGMTRRDVSSRFDEIVAFSGVERFLDTPVKRFSSGMYLRLAFAVAAHVEPDVLVVDEVLAVGDAEFQRRCLGRLAEAERQGRTVLYVSHDLESLARLCPRALWLEAGVVRSDGPTRAVVGDYLASGMGPAKSVGRGGRAGGVLIQEVSVVSVAEPGRRALLRDETLRIAVVFEVTDPPPGLDISVYVTTSRGVRVLDEALSDHSRAAIGTGWHRAELDVPPLLNVGDFTVGVWFGTAYDNVLDVAAAAPFTLHGSDRGRPDRVLVADLPIVVRALPGDPGD